MPAMGTFMQRRPARFAGKPWRQTDGAVFSVVEGTACVTLPRGEERWSLTSANATIS